MGSELERKLGQYLVEDGIITEEVLDACLAGAKAKGVSLGRVLTENNHTTEWEMASSFGKKLNVPFITLANYEIDQSILNAIPPDIIRKYNIVPVDKTGDTLTIALADPSNIYILDELRLLTNCDIVPVISFEADIHEAIDRYYGQMDDEAEDIAPINETDIEAILAEEFGDEESGEYLDMNDDEDPDDEEAQSAPVIQLVNAIIVQAIKMGASDIHIEPYEKSLRVRYRVDGTLQEVGRQPPKKWQNAMTSRIKIISELDIAERRVPQDGRFKYKVKGKAIDFRVSVCPVAYGEKVVMRLLDSSNLKLDLADLGFEPEPLEIFQRQIFEPYGMCLVTGPTGSGKSTTLYSALSTINDPTKNISTVEDPVEYQLRGINQVNVRSDIGLTFAAGLKSFLRQDPDIIMVGEIRDLETASIAIKAALTGHLVLSTLHTNDAPSTISRMTNMGVESFMVCAAVNCVLAQRLVKRICPDCKQEYTPSEEEKASIGLAGYEATFAQGAGCDSCFGSGMKGRLALHEVMDITHDLRDMIAEAPTTNQLKRAAIASGMLTLRMIGTRKVLQGVSTVAEVLGATANDECTEFTRRLVQPHERLDQVIDHIEKFGYSDPNLEPEQQQQGASAEPQESEAVPEETADTQAVS
jgi:type IV pilus assembly protein PilB